MMKARFLVAAAVAGVLVTSGCGGAPRNDAGQVTAPATTDAFQVKVGDCTGDLSSGMVSDVKLVPCDQDHNWEAYSSTQMTDTTYPGDSATQDQADKVCTQTFQTFVGIAAEKSKYKMVYFYPTQQTWDRANDREILCLVGPGSGTIKSSLKGAKK